jgi:hypothetical protein
MSSRDDEGILADEWMDGDYDGEKQLHAGFVGRHPIFIVLLYFKEVVVSFGAAGVFQADAKETADPLVGVGDEV